MIQTRGISERENFHQVGVTWKDIPGHVEVSLSLPKRAVTIVKGVERWGHWNIPEWRGNQHYNSILGNSK